MTHIQFYVSVDGSKPNPIDTAEIMALMKLVGRFTETASHAVVSVPSASAHNRPFPTVPPPGQRGLDYLIKGAETLPAGQPFKLSDMGDIMVSLGWVTTTQPGQQRANVVRQTAKNDKAKRFHNNGDGTWIYKP